MRIAFSNARRAELRKKYSSNRTMNPYELRLKTPIELLPQERIKFEYIKNP